MTSMRRCYVASTSFRRHVPTRFSINQCLIITFLTLKSDIIENSRIELKGIVLQVPSNQIKVIFIIILPFNLVQLWFFPVSHRNWRKCGWIIGGTKRYVGPPSQIIGGAWPPLHPPSSYAYVCGSKSLVCDCKFCFTDTRQFTSPKTFFGTVILILMLLLLCCFTFYVWRVC